MDQVEAVLLGTDLFTKATDPLVTGTSDQFVTGATGSLITGSTDLSAGGEGTVAGHGSNAVVATTLPVRDVRYDTLTSVSLLKRGREAGRDDTDDDENSSVIEEDADIIRDTSSLGGITTERPSVPVEGGDGCGGGGGGGGSDTDKCTTNVIEADGDIGNCTGDLTENYLLVVPTSSSGSCDGSGGSIGNIINENNERILLFSGESERTMDDEKSGSNIQLPSNLVRTSSDVTITSNCGDGDSECSSVANNDDDNGNYSEKMSQEGNDCGGSDATCGGGAITTGGSGGRRPNTSCMTIGFVMSILADTSITLDGDG